MHFAEKLSGEHSPWPGSEGWGGPSGDTAPGTAHHQSAPAHVTASGEEEQLPVPD